MDEQLAAPVHALERGLGNRGPIVDLRAGRIADYSSHPIWRLEVTLADDRRLSVIFKDLQPDARKAVHREVLLYQRLLAGGRFDAPLLYASVCDDAEERYWLFIEDVGRWRLDWCDRDDWAPAFRWMARMHAAFLERTDELAALDCLSEHGPAFYRGLAADARLSLRAHGEPGDLARFDRLAGRFLEPSIAYLDAQPRTLVHGDLSCHNVMVQRGRRIRPIDWEWAAIGVGAWDVAKLLAGWARHKSGFLAVYLDELGRHATATPIGAGFEASVAHCGIMQKLWYLRWWIEPCRELSFVEGLLDKIERRWERMDGVTG